MLKRIFASAVAWSILFSALRAGAAVFLLPVVLRTLPSEQLAMWYLFQSLGGAIVLLDFGIGPMTGRVAGYLVGGAKKILPFGIHPADEGHDGRPNYDGLRDLAATLRRFYRFFGITACTIMLVGGGSWIWIKSEGLASAFTIRGAYLLYCIGALINFTGDLWPALLTGMGEVRKAQQNWVVAILANYAISVIGLLTGFQLWALAAANQATGLIVRQLGRRTVRRRLSEDGVTTPGVVRWDLIKTLWPNGWRVAAVSGGGYLTSQANTLICATFLSLKTTASYGLTLQIITLVSTISTAWVTVNVPFINQLRAQNRNEDIARLFATRVRYAMGTYLLGATVVVLIGARLLDMLHSKTHCIALTPMLLLIASGFLDMHQYLYSSLVMSENHNPFVRPALISGACAIGLSCLLTPRYGLVGMILSMLIVQSAFNYWWTVWRGVKGLNIEPARYWKNFFGLQRI